MEPFTIVFLFFLTLSVAVQVWLSRRQIQAVRAHRNEVPEAFRDQIMLETHLRAADYTVAGLRLGFVELTVSTVLLLIWTLGGGLDALDWAWSRTGWTPLFTGTAFLLSTFLILGVLEIPLSAWRTFVLEQRFGFNRSTAGLFIADQLKQNVLLLLIGTPLAMLVLWLVQSSGALWWLYVWAVWMGFGLFMMWAYPVFIAPIFNKFSPLDDTGLRIRIEELLARCGFTSKGIFVMDGSRRSGHSNAYFTGLGTSKRIVFFDTLMGTLEPSEIEAVLAHELGHFKHRHIHKNLLVMSIFSLIGLALLGWLIGEPWFYTALGVSRPSTHTALMLFLLVAPVFTFFFQPLLASLMRRHEFEADDYAARQTNAEELIHALVKLYRENANTLTPDPVYSAYYDSHPPAPVRIEHLSGKMPG